MPKSMLELVSTWQTGETSLDLLWNTSDTLRMLPEIQDLEKLEKLQSWFYQRPESSRQLETPNHAGELLSPYFVWDNGKLEGFRLSKSREPSICALDAALRFLAYHVDFRQVEDPVSLPISRSDDGAVKLTIKDLDLAATNFIKRCQKNGTIASTPTSDTGTIFSTYGVFEIAHSFNSSNLKFQLKSECRKLVSQWKPKVVEALQKHFGYDDKASGYVAKAFRNAAGEPPCISASYYALRTLGRPHTVVDENAEAIRDFFQEQRAEKKAFLEFLNLSWDPTGGGFSIEPFGVADILHTRYALQVLRTLLHSRLVTQDEIKWLNVPAIMDFIMSCYSRGGFAIRPGYIPLLYTTRVALNSIKILEILRLHNCFDAGRSYLERRGQFNDIAGGIPDFVNECNSTPVLP